MTPEQIILDLKSRGEYNISFYESGLIASSHGKHTTNYWVVKDNELICIDCRSSYLPF